MQPTAHLHDPDLGHPPATTGDWAPDAALVALTRSLARQAAREAMRRQLNPMAASDDTAPR